MSPTTSNTNYYLYPGRRIPSGGKNVLIILLLTSILAHGILFSSRSIEPLLRGSGGDVVEQTVEFDETRIDNENHDRQPLRAKSLPPIMPRYEKEQPKHKELLPHWRLATECSSYSLDCFTRARRENKFLPYPFSPSLRKEVELSYEPDSNIVNRTTAEEPSTATTHHAERDEWSVERLDRIPHEWVRYVEEKGAGTNTNTNAPSLEERNYLYPPTVPEDEYQSCLDLTIHQNKSTVEQLDALLSGESPRIVPEPDTNMVAFTISDLSYVRDMLHEVFQMMDDVVGFSRHNFFLVAIDRQSVELACKHGYSVVLWKTDEDNLKDAVANTKIEVSHDLVKRGVDFFFTEMDVWWIRSPKQKLIDFKNKHNDNNNGEDENDHNGKHIYFSGHQNNYGAPNIGVYAVKADKYSEEYFRVCLDVLKEKPETHDQWVLAEVHRLFEHTYTNRPYKLGGRFEPDGPPETPKIQNSFEAMYFSPHEVVADERPMPTHQTMAIHTLNNAPLQMPHGKKMIAKELGVYYGFHTHPRTNRRASIDEPTGDPLEPSARPDDNLVAAGYYDRSGENYRRYIWLDTDIRSNFYSIVENVRYHDKHALEWTMALLIAIARKTDRILVLPQIFDADMDAGTYFLWNMMDYSGLSDTVEFRETNFLSNPKAWRNGGKSEAADPWPFESVANTALFQSQDDRESISIYTQVSDRDSIVSKKAWTARLHDHDFLDAWIGSFFAVPEMQSAEVLLVNPDLLMNSGRIWGMVTRLRFDEYHAQEIARNKQPPEPIRSPPPVGRMEQEIFEIYKSLRWCWDTGLQHTVSKASASDSCYGIGNHRQY